MVLTSQRDGARRTYLADPDGSGVEPLFGDGRYLYPYWSPDGTRLVAYTEDGGKGEVFLLNADGTGAVNLTDAPGQEWVSVWTQDPWSPDGRILFQSDRSGDGDLWVMNADGSEARNLTHAPGSREGPEAAYVPAR